LKFTEFGLDQRLLNAIQHLGFETATEIQQRAIPAAMAGKDLIASSKTGSGKTLAYLLPAMHRLLHVRALSKRDARMLILTPTRELARQVAGQLRLLLGTTQFHSAVLLGGENFNDQIKMLRRNPQILVATPGRLVDHLSQRSLFLEGLELLILDEADRMLDLGFAAQLKQIHQAASHRRRQTLMFSATVDDDIVEQFAVELLREPVRIAVGFINEQHQDIEQQFFLCDHLDHKQALLIHLLTQPQLRQAIVFTATRADTERLATELTRQGMHAMALSADLNQSSRNQIMDAFSRARARILVTTDVASRGLDLANVSHVINFDMPKQAQEYVHRIGRTGRAGKQGHACSLIGPNDWHSFKRVEAFLGTAVEFSTVVGLEARFQGLKPKPSPFLNRKPATATNAPGGGKPGQARPKGRRDKGFIHGTDTGHGPLRRKKPGTQ